MTPGSDLAAAVTAAAAEMRKRSTHTTERVRETVSADVMAVIHELETAQRATIAEVNRLNGILTDILTSIADAKKG